MPMTMSNAALPVKPGRWIFPFFVIFSVVFYSQRYIFGWSPSDLTIYSQDMPDSIRVVKDIVWLGFLAAIFIWRFADRDSVIALVRRNSFFFAVLAAFVAWLAFAGFIHLMRGDSATDVLLFWYRYPLEYIPMAALMPMFVEEYERLGRLAVFLSALTVLFMLMEMFSGRQTGFQWSEGGPARYGSIFGSPNDFGVFCAFMLLAIVIYGRSKWHWAIGAGLAVGLAASVSRSAWVGFVAGLIPLLHFRRIRLLLLFLIVALGGLIVLALRSDAVDLPTQAVYFAERLSIDESSYDRLDQVKKFSERFSDWDNLATLTFGTNFFRIEDQYLAFLIRGGAIGLILFLAAAGLTVRRGWKLRRCSKLHAVGLSTVVVILVASLFIPFLDVFPTNLYFWMAVGIVWLPVQAMPCL